MLRPSGASSYTGSKAGHLYTCFINTIHILSFIGKPEVRFKSHLLLFEDKEGGHLIKKKINNRSTLLPSVGVPSVCNVN